MQIELFCLTCEDRQCCEFSGDNYAFVCVEAREHFIQGCTGPVYLGFGRDGSGALKRLRVVKLQEESDIGSDY